MELKYLDRVRVTKGFYEGLEGEVTDERHADLELFKYYVEMNTVQNACFIRSPKDWILEDCLEKIEEVSK